MPVALTEILDAHQRCMRGTWSKQPRCVALEGEVGGRTRCAIYDARPNACRELRMSWEDGAPNPQCDNARMRYGLTVLMREDVERMRDSDASTRG